MVCAYLYSTCRHQQVFVLVTAHTGLLAPLLETSKVKPELTTFEEFRNLGSTMDEGFVETKGITLIAKWGKERITLDHLNEDTSIGIVKDLLLERTGVLQKRQKLIGLAAKGGSKINDNVLLGDLKVKAGKKPAAASGIVHEFIMMGTKEEQIFVDPADKGDLPDVIDDFDLDFNAGSSEVSYHIAHNLKMHRTSLHLIFFPSQVAATRCKR